MILSCGDFNARCGNLIEVEDDADIPTRTIIDKNINSVGRFFIQMLKALDLCIRSGCFDYYNGFTSVSTKGLAVVDYCLVPAASFRLFKDFQVYDVLDNHKFVN